MDTQRLERLTAGMPIVFGGDRVTRVPAALADAFAPGDALLVVQETGALLHLPQSDRDVARDAVDRATAAFERMGAMPASRVTRFFEVFAELLADEEAFAHIAAANADDVASARARGRSTTRLVLDERMREGMIQGLRTWASTESVRGQVRRTIDHGTWVVEEVIDGLGVVGFVFEGRPNVFADATGVLRSGNTVVFRIGSDALGTARAIVQHALDPALAQAGLPPGAVALVDSPAHAAGWALFSDPRLALAVARGSGTAVAQLGAVAREAGNAVSLHGTGGAWLIAAEDADADDFAAAVTASLDRKVCNTLNTCCVPRSRATELVPAFLAAVQEAASRLGTSCKVHVLDRSRDEVPAEWFERMVPIERADGIADEPQAQVLPEAQLGLEWEWERSPEVTLAVAQDLDEAIGWCNTYSPRFGASLISDARATHERFFAEVQAPFVGNGFTRWVDGQYVLATPELGLSNWEHGRLLGRTGILSGDSVFTVRMRATQTDPHLSRWPSRDGPPRE